METSSMEIIFSFQLSQQYDMFVNSLPYIEHPKTSTHSPYREPVLEYS